MVLNLGYRKKAHLFSLFVAKTSTPAKCRKIKRYFRQLLVEQAFVVALST